MSFFEVDRGIQKDRASIMFDVQKEYADNGLELVEISSGCPQQFEVINPKVIAYYRIRHGEFTVDVPDCDGEEIWKHDADGDGALEDHELKYVLGRALQKVKKHYEITT